jgi:hypothetical protein
MVLQIRSITVEGRQVAPSRVGDAVVNAITATVDRGVKQLREPVMMMLLKVYDALEKKHSGTRTRVFPFGRSKRSMRLNRISGRGLDSIRNSIRVRMNGRQGMVGMISAGRMGIHEEGGTVRARNGRYLAIPTVYADGLSGPRDVDNGFFKRTRKGNLFLFERQGNSIKPMYLMKKSVKIKPRLGLAKTLEAHLPHFEAKLVAAFLRGI